jgi:CRP-like cAMP-binding protein
MALKKQRVLPDEYVVKQGDDGKTAFLIVSGALSVEI